MIFTKSPTFFTLDQKTANYFAQQSNNLKSWQLVIITVIAVINSLNMRFSFIIILFFIVILLLLIVNYFNYKRLF